MFRMFSVTLEQVFKDLSRWASFTLFALWNCRFFEEFVIPSWLKIEWNSRCDEFCHIFSFFSFYMSVHLFQIFGTIKMIFAVRCPTTLCPVNSKCFFAVLCNYWLVGISSAQYLVTQIFVANTKLFGSIRFHTVINTTLICSSSYHVSHTEFLEKMLP